MKVLHTEWDAFDDDARAIVEAVATVVSEPCRDEEALVAACLRHHPDALFVRIGLPVTATVLRTASIRAVVTPTTGLDHIDLEAVRRAGVELISLRGQLDVLRTVAATAELTWGLLIAVQRHLLPAVSLVREGRWDRTSVCGTELAGRTLGVVGYGRLGRMVGGYGVAFGMTVLAHDTDPSTLASLPAGVRPATDLEDLLAASDVVTLHLPLDGDTEGIIDEHAIALMRPGSVLVNTARGELVDEPALLDALRRGHLAGAGLDVVADDSTWPGRVPPHQPLIEFARAHPNVVITPHIGGYARDAIASTRRHVAERFATFARQSLDRSPE